jgi:large subunit ribosomal protein L25
MLDVVLRAEKREGSGKVSTKALRRTGKVPGVLYGRGEETLHLVIDAKQLSNLIHSIHGEAVLVTLQLGDEQSKDRKVIFKELQRDPVRGNVLHLDLHHISMTENIKVEVPIILKGTPIGVRSKGGIIQHALHRVEIECLPMDIPEHFEINVEGLDVGDSVHVRDIVFEKGRILADEQRTVVNVVPPTIIKEAVPAEEAKEETKEPEVIEKGESKEEEK